MIDVFTVGFSALQEIREIIEELELVIHAHRAMHAVFTRNKQHGITMLALAKIMRLIGMDQLHTGTIIGKMEGDKKEVLNTNKVITESQILGNNETILNQDWWDIKPTLPVASGGLSPIHIPELYKILGKDMVYQFGGGCHGHPNGTFAGAKAIRQALNASLDGLSLNEAASSHIELKNAIDKWGSILD